MWELPSTQINNKNRPKITPFDSAHGYLIALKSHDVLTMPWAVYPAKGGIE